MDRDYLIYEIAQFPVEIQQTLADFTKHVFAACKAFHSCPPRLSMTMLFRQSLLNVLREAGIVTEDDEPPRRQKRLEQYTDAYEDKVLEIALCLLELASRKEMTYGNSEPLPIHHRLLRQLDDGGVVDEILTSAADAPRNVQRRKRPRGRQETGRSR